MDASTVIGLLHPGEMGAEVGRCLAERGHLVLWASHGRSEQTATRAAMAGLTDAGTAADLAGRADAIISVCPPHGALAVARSVRGFGGLYVDANAISPATARQVAEIAASSMRRVVYVSCNPATLGRDAGLLRSAGFRILSALPVDQFLWSARLESVVVLAR